MSKLIAFTGLVAEVEFEFIGRVLEGIGIGRGRFLAGNIGPFERIVPVQLQ